LILPITALKANEKRQGRISLFCGLLPHTLAGLQGWSSTLGFEIGEESIASDRYEQVFMGVRINGVMLRRVKGNKDIRLLTQVLYCMRDTRREKEAPSLFVRDNRFSDFAMLTIAHQGRPKYIYRLRALRMIMVASHDTGKAYHDVRIPLSSKILGPQKFENKTPLICDDV
jgi:hypothetical protein